VSPRKGKGRGIEPASHQMQRCAIVQYEGGGLTGVDCTTSSGYVWSQNSLKMVSFKEKGKRTELQMTSTATAALPVQSQSKQIREGKCTQEGKTGPLSPAVI